MPTRTRLTAAILAAGLALAACGGDDGDDGAAATAATTTAAASAATTTAAPAATTTTVSAATTTAAASAATTTAATATTAAASAATCQGLTAPAAGATAVSTTLIEWAVNSPATVKAGAVAMTIKNDSINTHAFMLAKGTYETLPKISNGALDEAQLGANLLGQVRLNANETCLAGFTLAAGSYTIVCNINQGPNSHAARGQKMNFTVA